MTRYDFDDGGYIEIFENDGSTSTCGKTANEYFEFFNSIYGNYHFSGRPRLLIEFIESKVNGVKELDYKVYDKMMEYNIDKLIKKYTDDKFLLLDEINNNRHLTRSSNSPTVLTYNQIIKDLEKLKKINRKGD